MNSKLRAFVVGKGMVPPLPEPARFHPAGQTGNLGSPRHIVNRLALRRLIDDRDKAVMQLKRGFVSHITPLAGRGQ